MRKSIEIEGMYEQFSEKIWYIRHVIRAAKIANGEIELNTLADRRHSGSHYWIDSGSVYLK